MRTKQNRNTISLQSPQQLTNFRSVAANINLKQLTKQYRGMPSPLSRPRFVCRQVQNAVAATTVLWTETVTSGTYDAPKKTAALYAPDAVLWGTEVCGPDDDLWGTVSESIRETPPQIYAYFVSHGLFVVLCVVGLALFFSIF